MLRYAWVGMDLPWQPATRKEVSRLHCEVGKEGEGLYCVYECMSKGNHALGVVKAEGADLASVTLRGRCAGEGVAQAASDGRHCPIRLTFGCLGRLGLMLGAAEEEQVTHMAEQWQGPPSWKDLK